MRKLALAALTAALLLALAAPAAAGERAAAACAKKGRPIDGNALVRVFHGDGYRACSLENGRTVFLGDVSEGGASGIRYVRPLAVAGRFVGWSRVVCPPHDSSNPCIGVLSITDVRSGTHRLRRRYAERGFVDELVVSPDGSAAWIEDDQRGARTLRVLDARGEMSLAHGDTRELALSERNLLYWTQAGQPTGISLDVGLGPEPSRRPRAGRCRRPGRSIAANPWARVSYDGTYVFVACSQATGREHRLGQEDASSSIRPVAAAGHLVAWYRSAVRLLDLRSGARRTLAAVPPGERVSELLLKRNGSVAFVQSDQVRLVDARGDRIAGPGEDLALSHGSTLYWTGPGRELAATRLE